MIYQTTPGLLLQIKKTGCYFLCVLRIFEIITKHSLTVNEVNKIFELSVKVKYISKKGFMKIKASRGVAQIASGYINKHVYLKKVNEIQNHNFLIGGYNNKKDFHFILMPGPLNKVYDPWSPEGSNTVENGKFHSYRYHYGEAI